MLDMALKILPSNYHIMCHCFLAGDKMLRRIWFFFPKMLFSISPKAFYHSSKYMEDTLKTILTSQLVLETNSPHLTFLTKDDACPSMVVLVGREVGWALHLPQMIILHQHTPAVPALFPSRDHTIKSSGGQHCVGSVSMMAVALVKIID